MIYIFYNPLANSSHGEEDAVRWSERLNSEPSFQSLINFKLKPFISKLRPNDEVVLLGGDGTLNHFVNDIYGMEVPCKLSYVKSGTGNDFYRDVKDKEEDGRIDLKPYIVHLPLIKVNGIERRFINNIGFGIDGETAYVGSQIRAKNPQAKINFSSIAIGLLLGKYKTKISEVEVDGIKSIFKNTWLATVMNGRYYGGGMMAAPEQDRLNKGHECDLVVFSSFGRIITLLRFPKFSAGKHKNKNYITHLQGKHIKVTFSTPCVLQIDGEIVTNVITYEVFND